MNLEDVFLVLACLQTIVHILALIFSLHSRRVPTGKNRISPSQTNSQVSCMVAFINIVEEPNSDPCSANKLCGYGIAVLLLSS